MQIWTPKPVVEREPWWALCEQTGRLYGPLDPGTVWFETPVDLRDWQRRGLAWAADYLLNAAGAGADQLDRALCLRYPGDPLGLRKPTNQSAFYARMICAMGGISWGAYSLRQIAATLVYGWLGDGAAAVSPGVGLTLDDSKNGTTASGPVGGAGDGNAGGRGRDGAGVGRGSGGASNRAADPGSASAGGGGGYGTAGANGAAGASPEDDGYGEGGQVHGEPNLLEAMRVNVYTLAQLLWGGGGGGGGYAGAGPGTGGAGGAAGSNYVEVVIGILTTVARSLAGTAGSGGTSGTGGGGGGGSGGDWAGIAGSIAYGSGTIATDGGAGGGGGSTGGAGGNGRVRQVYFDDKATLTVTGATQTQYRILRGITPGAGSPRRTRSLPV